MILTREGRGGRHQHRTGVCLTETRYTARLTQQYSRARQTNSTDNTTGPSTAFTSIYFAQPSKAWLAPPAE